MNTRILLAAVATSLISRVALAQMGGYGSGMTQTQPPAPSTGGQQMATTSTKTKTTYPVGVKGYLDQQLAMSKDKKFHVSLNGKDVGLTPVKFHQETKLGGGKSATAVDMKGVDGKMYEIDFVSSGGQVTGASVGKVNGKAP